MSKAHILVTNDDGIDSPFLRALVDALKDHFTVSIAAPIKQQSWIGRALSRYKKVTVKNFDHTFNSEAWGIDGTPTDCANIALSHLLKTPPAAVVSGININMNVSLLPALSSGTIAGAIEGALWGLPAFAFSKEIPEELKPQAFTQNGHIDNNKFNASLKTAATIAANFVKENITASKDPIVHNINFPSSTFADTPIVRTELGHLGLRRLFKKQSDDVFTFEYPTDTIPPNNPQSDIQTVLAGNISHTVLDYSVLGKIKN